MTLHQVDADLPVGTVTFLQLDMVELEQVGREGARRMCCPSMVRVVLSVDQVTEIVARHGGTYLVDLGERDESVGGVAVFSSARSAVHAASELQRAVDALPDGEGRPTAVRIGIDSGEACLTDGRTYGGIALRRAARLRDVAHGGQVLLSSITASLVTDALPTGVWLADLGVHRLRGLYRPERIFELRHAQLLDRFPPLGSLDVLANNLPTQLTSFIGRERELAVVQQLLGQGRMVTLTGSGGCGKTRLAVQSATRLAGGWPDGVWWVDLGPISDPSRVAELAAASLRLLVEPKAGPLPALTRQLRDRQLLLCLDNCEHLLGSSGELAGALLESCPGVSVLTTSREPIGVSGEVVWRVPSLPEDEAVRLFADRAGSIDPGFTVSPDDEPAIRTICDRLDGIPLAIELAAAWVQTLTPAQIARGLDDRFRLLTGGVGEVVARQRTLEASVQWSHDLVDEADRTVFRRLAVFAGEFGLDAAQVVCATDELDESDVLASLRRLVAKSLVTAEHCGDEARYRLLETIRQYAHDQLNVAGEAAPIRDRHLDWFLRLAETAEPELEEANQDSWLERLEMEHGNLRAALDWGLSAPDPNRGRRLAAALPRLWLLHGHAHVGIGYLKKALALDDGDRSELQTRLHFGTALVAATNGRFDRTIEAAEHGLALADANGDDRHRGRCLGLQAYVQVYLDVDAAQELCIRARHHAEAARDDFGIDLSLELEGFALVNGDRHDEARPVLELAVERCRRRNDRILTAFALTGLMEIAQRSGDISGAERLATEAMQLAEPLGDYFTVGATTSNLAWVKGMSGDISTGRRLLEKVLRSVESADHAVDVPTLAVTIGQLHLWDGDPASARPWLEQASRYGEPFVDNLIVARALPGLATTYRFLGDVDKAEQTAKRALALARQLGIGRLAAEALDELGWLRADDPDRATELHHEALSIRLDEGLRTSYTDSLDALGRCASGVGDDRRATRLYGASSRARNEIGYPRQDLIRADHETDVAALRSRLGGRTFDRIWSEGHALSLDEAVAFVRRRRTRRGRPSSGWASLTPTELEVVGLVVDGLTNDEASARLFVSRNTVKTHLAHIYAKLGVANRTQLAAYAMSRTSRTTGAARREGR